MLIFDEVVTGFRLAYGGAQEKYGVVPDLCTLGKVIGGGFPLAAIAGKEVIMRHFDRDAVGSAGFTLQIGTLSGNPVAATAGLKTMEILRRPGTYEQLRATGQTLMDACERALCDNGHKVEIVGDPVLFDVVFTDRRVRNYRDILDADTAKALRFNALLREGGIFKSPGKTYISTALTERDISDTIAAIETAARRL